MVSCPFLLYLFIIYKLNIDIAVIAGHSQRFFPAIFFVRQIAFPFFYFGLDRKIIITPYNRAGNISIFNV